MIGTAGSSDASAGIWSEATGRQLATLNGQTDDISNVAVSPDGRYALRMWNIEEVVK